MSEIVSSVAASRFSVPMIAVSPASTFTTGKAYSDAYDVLAGGNGFDRGFVDERLRTVGTAALAVVSRTLHLTHNRLEFDMKVASILLFY